MQNHNITDKQLGIWTFAALTAPLAQIAGGISWMTVALTGVICLTVCWILGRKTVYPGKWLCVAELVWIVCVLGSMIRWMAGSWHAGEVYPAVPLMLLALSAASAAQGTEKAARAGSMVFWLVALVYSAVAIAGIGETDLLVIGSAGVKLEGRLAAVFLFPALTAFIPIKGKKLPVRALAAAGVFGIGISVLVTGALSLPVAQRTASPLYDWVRGLRILDTLQRFEAVVSVALTMGWFALLSFQLSVAGNLAERIKKGGYKAGVWLCAAAAGLSTLVSRWIDTDVLVAGCILLWAIVPIICVSAGRIKKS